MSLIPAVFSAAGIPRPGRRSWRRKLGSRFINDGKNGRKIPEGGQEFLQFRRDAEQYNADMLIVMLGTNDLLEGAKAGEVARRMEVLLTGCTLPITLLVSPPPMKRGAWVPDDGLVEASRELSGQYKALAERLGLRYADAGEWHIDLTFDGVHFTEEGHIHFAEGLASCLGRIYT